MVSSRVVLALVSLISPLAYQGDFRPFFTIYDPDCALYSRMLTGKGAKKSRERQTACPAILGVTNPHFDTVKGGGGPTRAKISSRAS